MYNFLNKKITFFKSHNLLGKLFPILFLAGIIFFVFSNETLAAADIGESVAEGFFSAINWLLYRILWVITLFLTQAIAILIWIGQYQISLDDSLVNTGWIVLRDLANMFFVIVLLLISFGTILRIDQFQVKSWLPKVVLMGILVNFSKVIVGFFVEISQVVLLTFAAAYQQAGAGNFIRALQIDNLVSIVADGAEGVGESDLFGAIVGAIIYSIVALVVIIAFLGMFLIRIAAIWLLAVFSPLAFALSAVPGGAKYASIWWDNFSKYVIIGPVLAFFLWFSLATLPTVTKTQDNTLQNDQTIVAALQEGAPKGATVATQPVNFFHFMLSTVVLVMSLYFAQQIGGAIGKVAGGTVSRLQSGGLWAARKTGNLVTKYPRGVAQKVGYNVADKALGLAGTVSTSALLKQGELRSRRAEGQKEIASRIASLDDESRSKIADRSLFGGRLLKGIGRKFSPGIAAAIKSGSNLFRSETGKAIAENSIVTQAEKGSFGPDYDDDKVVKATRAKINAENTLRRLKHDGVPADDSRYKEQTRIVDDSNKVIDASKKKVFGAMMDALDSISGKKVDPENNVSYDDDKAGRIAEGFYKRLVRFDDAGKPITVSRGPRELQEAQLAPDRQAYHLERWKKSDKASIEYAAAKDQAFMNKLHDATTLKALAAAFKAVGKSGLEPGSDEFNRRMANALRSAFSGDHAAMDESARMFDAMGESFSQWIEDGGKEKVKAAMVGNNIGNEDKVLTQIVSSYRAGRGGGYSDGTSGAKSSTSESSESEESSPAQIDIDDNKYQRTVELMSAVGINYAESDEYQANPEQYYQPENFDDVQFRLNERGRQPYTTIQDIESVGGGAVKLMEEHEQAPIGADGAKLKLAEATLLADIGKLHTDFEGSAGRSLNWDRDGELLEEILPKILEQQRSLNGLSDEEVSKLEEALRDTQNISLVDRNRSMAEGLQTVSHERMEALLRLPDFKKFVDGIWDALSPEEQSSISVRVKDLFGDNLSEEDVKREFVAEATANEETRFGRKTGLRFTEKQRAVWNQGPQAVREEIDETVAVAPTAEFDEEKFVSNLMKAMEGLNMSGADIDLSALEDSLKELKELVPGFSGNKLQGDGVVRAIEKVMRSQSNSGEKSVMFLRRMLESLRNSNKNIKELASNIDDSRLGGSANNEE